MRDFGTESRIGDCCESDVELGSWIEQRIEKLGEVAVKARVVYEMVVEM
jgi:hypothetical protein